MTTAAAPATMTVNEAARLLGISRQHAYNAVASRDIPSVRIGRRILIPRNSLLALLMAPEPRETVLGQLSAAGGAVLGEESGSL